jgi:uncharacterized protein YkwD
LVLAIAGVFAASADAQVARAPISWAAWTSSPRPVVVAGDAVASDREAELLARCGQGEEGLREVAAQIARERTEGKPRLDLDALTFALRAAGEPHVWPRAWVAAGKTLDRATTLAKLEAWGATFQQAGERRCGVAMAASKDGTQVVAAVALDAVADLAPLPTRAHVGMSLTLDAHFLISASNAHVLVQGPDEDPHAIPAWIQTEAGEPHLRARFLPDRPGAFTVQVVADGASGPRPMLEARVFADVPPPAHFEEGAAPGETAPAPSTTDEADQLTAMVAGLRRWAGLGPLARDARLDALAAAHAARMKAARTVGHDVGDGDPIDRLSRMGESARLVGENVAHAGTTRLAHRALYESPSHRANLLRPEFDRIGVAVVRDSDGSVWVSEEFAAGLE